MRFAIQSPLGVWCANRQVSCPSSTEHLPTTYKDLFTCFATTIWKTCWEKGPALKFPIAGFMRQKILLASIAGRTCMPTHATFNRKLSSCMMYAISIPESPRQASLLLKDEYAYTGFSLPLNGTSLENRDRERVLKKRCTPCPCVLI